MNQRHDSPMRALAQAILQDEDPTACADCLDNLEAYVNLQLDNGDYRAALPTVAAHLDGCVACSQSYALLYNLLLAERLALVPVPVAIPQPDLSFLPTRPSLGALLRGAVQQLGTQIRLRFSQELLELLRAPAQPALALRDASGTPLYVLELPAPNVAIERLSLAVYADERAADRCLVQVSVALPGRGWPDLGGIAVHLSGPDIDERATTDPWGEAAFEEVPLAALAALVVEVG